jgi:hypothetical protein
MLLTLPRRLDRILDAVERNELAVGVHLFGEEQDRHLVDQLTAPLLTTWVDDADQGRAVLDTRAAAVTGWWGGQQRLDGLPQLLGDEIVSGDHGGGSCGRAGRAARTGRSSETLFKAPANARTASCAMLNCAMPARTSSCVVYRPNEMRTVLWGTILQAHRDEDVARLDVVGRAGRSHRHRDAAGGSAHQR